MVEHLELNIYLPRDVIKKEIKNNAAFIREAQRSVDAMYANQDCEISLCNPQNQNLVAPKLKKVAESISDFWIQRPTDSE